MSRFNLFAADAEDAATSNAENEEAPLMLFKTGGSKQGGTSSSANPFAKTTAGGAGSLFGG